MIVADDFDFYTIPRLGTTRSPPLLQEQHERSCRGHSICFYFCFWDAMGSYFVMLH